MKFKSRLRRLNARHCALLLKLCYSTIILSIFAHYINNILPNNERIKTKMQIQRKNPLKHTNELINLNNFQYLRNPQICSVMEDILSIIVVTSSPLRYEFRKAVRITWGQQNADFKIVFVLGEIEDEITKTLVKLEHEIYGDIVQGNFIDTDKNETYKHIMALKWALFHCPNVKFIVKASDAIVVNIDELKNVLQHRLQNKNKYLIACRLNTDLLVKRSKSDTFYVSKEEYSRKHFPTCCSGLFIIYSPDSAARLVESSRTSPYLYLNNVYVTGTVSMKLKINITNISDLTLEQHRFDDLIYDDDENLGNFLFGPQSITPDNIRTLWKFLKYIKKDNKPIEDNKKQTEIRNTTTLRIFNGTTNKRSELIDLLNFKFLRNSLVCQNDTLLAIIIVSSSPYNYYKRQAIRNTWVQDGNFFKLVFLFGEIDDVVVEETIKLEYAKYKDIVQGNFIDTYKNLTYKHVMGLQWATQHCSNVKFVLKIDDDIFVNVEELKVLLNNFSSEVNRELIACKFNSNLMVHRSKYNKWFVSRDEYEQDKYPQYCTGSFILYSQEIALRIVAASKTTQYIHVDDFYVTGLLANKLKVNITNIEHLYIKPAEYKDADSKGFVDKTYVFGPINSSPQDNERLWTLTKISRHKRKLGDKKRNKKSTEFSEPTTISNDQGTPGSRKYGNGQHRKSQGIPEFRKNESNITNMTLYSVHAKDEKGKNEKSNESDGIKPGNYNTLTRPIKGKRRETTDLMDIYVPIPKLVLAKFRKKTNERNIKMLMFKRLGTMTKSTKLNKQIFTRKRIQR